MLRKLLMVGAVVVGLLVPVGAASASGPNWPAGCSMAGLPFAQPVPGRPRVQVVAHSVSCPGYQLWVRLSSQRRLDDPTRWVTYTRVVQTSTTGGVPAFLFGQECPVGSHWRAEIEVVVMYPNGHWTGPAPMVRNSPTVVC